MGRHVATLVVRVPEELEAELEAKASEQGLSKSALVRGLLELGLGNPQSVVIVREAHMAVGGVLKHILNDLVVNVHENLPEILEKHLAMRGED